MLEIFQDSIIDTVKLLPFLFITYLIMEYIEHKMSEKSKNIITIFNALSNIYQLD